MPPLPDATGDTTEDTLLGGRVRLRQPVQGLRAGLDAVLLAASIPARPGQTVLEAGCGTGAVFLCLLARVPDLHILAVEREPELAELARHNAAANNVADRVTILTGDVTDPALLQERRVHHACANPPYWPGGGPPPPPPRRPARPRRPAPPRPPPPPARPIWATARHWNSGPPPWPPRWPTRAASPSCCPPAASPKPPWPCMPPAAVAWPCCPAGHAPASPPAACWCRRASTAASRTTCTPASPCMTTRAGARRPTPSSATPPPYRCADRGASPARPAPHPGTPSRTDGPPRIRPAAGTASKFPSAAQAFRLQEAEHRSPHSGTTSGCGPPPVSRAAPRQAAHRLHAARLAICPAPPPGLGLNPRPQEDAQAP